MTRSQRSQVGFILSSAVSLLLGWRILVDTFALSLHNDEYTQILLVLPVSAVLIFLERKSLRANVALGVRGGSVLLSIAAVIAFFTFIRSASLTTDLQLAAGMFALVLWWLGAFVLWFGCRALRATLFPLCFLFGLVPLPTFVMNAIIALLQEGSAWTAHLLFSVMGVPVSQDGFLLTIPGLTVQVAQECSSIRSSSMLLVTTMVLAHLLLRSPSRKGLVIGFAIPLSVAKNGLRICTIATLGTRVDPGYLTGRLHHQGGILFFAVALVAVFFLLWILRKGDHGSSTAGLAT